MRGPLLARRSECAAGFGFSLTPTERAILDSVPEPQLRQMIESLPDHDAEWAVPEDVPSLGITPDMPPPRCSAGWDGLPPVAPQGIRPDMPPPRQDSPAPQSWFDRLRRFVLGK
jgi:hypothetical protein